MYEWSLTDLYPSYESKEFQSDLKSLDELLTRFQSVKTEDNLQNIKSVIQLIEERTVIQRRLGAFIRLNQATNTTDKVSANYSAILESKMANFSSENARLRKFLGNIKTDITQDDYLAQYKFYFEEAKQDASHLLSDEVEAVISKMNLSAGSSWSTLQSYLTSTVEGELDGEKVTLPQVRNLAYEENPETRKKAYFAELEMYRHIKAPIAFALNNIKSQVNDIAALRGFESPLAQTLERSRMKRETLDALISAMEDSLPTFRKYLKHKAKLLGHKNGLPFYDLFAPMGKSSRTFTVEEAKEFLMKVFSGFSQDLADMTKEMYDKKHIDVFPKKGKVGGAFCSNLPFIKQSRVLLNDDGLLGSLVTAAHELGHAYHGLHIQSHLPLNWSYSMPVAETASTFNENLLLNPIIAGADKEEKINLIEQQLQDVTQIIVDIYSRYLFESEVFEKRKSAFLFADELEEIMLDAQRKAYGDGLDPEVLHPYMWVNKGHYYSESNSFYNFPYAFGGLFSKGLYALYQEKPEGFVEKYQQMLKATTVGSVEDTAKVMGIDLSKKEFWAGALKMVEKSIDEFIELTK
ncbi:MAG: M3 family oligoendopeptidase [Peptostreptococcaceae bacterium]|nr:M3 family oligoendopeptidase [Peptostreptococcaceae bacterium]